MSKINNSHNIKNVEHIQKIIHTLRFKLMPYIPIYRPIKSKTNNERNLLPSSTKFIYIPNEFMNNNPIIINRKFLFEREAIPLLIIGESIRTRT